jgi:lipopolysaccharide transport system ATP-binding protein
MGEPVVVFDHVWKKFRRGERHDSLRDLVPSMLRRMLGRAHPTELEDREEFWAIKDTSFEVQAGQALGIIGPNGAGKSTALKLLTRILRPTRGSCFVKGRVGALIEVSAGFHPDLTGRENISLQGAVMGMRQEDIARQFDAIIEFAGLAEFIDTPIKRYSSGMNARLGFSIAAHLNPDVLIIDEVLAVGDSAFQQRCFERIRFLKQSGVTLVFVSHNLAAVEALCDTTVLLVRGTPVFVGSPHEATRRYLDPRDDRPAADLQAPAHHAGSGTVAIAAVRLVSRGRTIDRLRSGDAVVIEIDLSSIANQKDIVVGLLLLDESQTIVFGENGSVILRPFDLVAGESATCRVTIRSLALPEGRYSLTVVAHSAITGEVYDERPRAQSIQIEARHDTTRIGTIGLLTEWSLERHQRVEPSVLTAQG